MHPPLLRNKLIAYMGERRGQWVSREELLGVLYADREDGGPMTALYVLRHLMWELRSAGIPIESTFVYRIPPRR